MLLSILKKVASMLAHVEVTKPAIPRHTWQMDKHCTWGNMMAWMDWDSRRLYGHTTPRPVEGDELLVSMRSGKTARLRFSKVEYCRDPADMWFATMEDAGYVEAAT